MPQDDQGFGEQDQLLEVYKKNDALLLEASDYLYPRFRVATWLLTEYYAQLHGLPEGKMSHFLQVVDVEKAAAFVQREFDRDKAFYDTHPPDPWKPGQKPADFREWHVPYEVDRRALLDGADMFYHILGYIQTEFEIDPASIDGGEVWAAVKYSREILDNLRILRFIPEERMKKSTSWAQETPVYSPGMTLAGADHPERTADIMTVEASGEGVVTGAGADAYAAHFNDIIRQRDLKLEQPYLLFTGEFFDSLLASR